MKVSAVCLSIVLLAALLSLTSAVPIGADPNVCCFGYLTHKLPQSHVKDYFYTSGRCSEPGVVFITRKDRQVCANPSARWVKEYVNALELQ